MNNKPAGNKVNLEKIIGLILYILLLYLSLRFFQFDQRTILIPAAIAILLAGYLITKRKDLKLLYWIAGIILLAVVLRGFWLASITPHLKSDFVSYYQKALTLSKGIVEPKLYKNPGYVIFLSLALRGNPEPMSGGILNIFINVLTIAGLYLFGKKIKNETVGLLAAGLMAVFPADIQWVGLLGPEIMSTFLLLGASLFFPLTNSEKNISRNLWLSGLFYGIGILCRTSLIFYIPAFAIIIYRINKKHMEKFLALLKFSGGALAIILLSLTWHSISQGKATISLIRSQDAFPFLSGTNTEHEGKWNKDDAQLYASWPEDEKDRMAIDEAKRRVFNNPGDFLKIVPIKLERFIGNSTYGANWGIADENKATYNFTELEFEDFKQLNRDFAQAFYLVIILGGLHFFMVMSNKESPELLSFALLSALFIIFNMLFITIVEAQARYHHYLLPYIILTAALGIEKITSKTTQEAAS